MTINNSATVSLVMISSKLVVLSCIGCLWMTSVIMAIHSVAFHADTRLILI